MEEDERLYQYGFIIFNSESYEEKGFILLATSWWSASDKFDAIRSKYNLPNDWCFNNNITYIAKEGEIVDDHEYYPYSVNDLSQVILMLDK